MCFFMAIFDKKYVFLHLFLYFFIFIAIYAKNYDFWCRGVSGRPGRPGRVLGAHSGTLESHHCLRTIGAAGARGGAGG